MIESYARKFAACRAEDLSPPTRMKRRVRVPPPAAAATAEMPRRR